MKKNLLLLFLFLGAAQLLFAQQKTVGSSRVIQANTNAAKTQTGTTNKLQTANNLTKVVPIPKTIKYLRYTKSLMLTAQQNNVMDRKTTLPTNANTRVNTTLRQPMGYTVSRTYSDGRKAYYTLTSNTNSWPNTPSYSKNVASSKQDNSQPGWNCTVNTQSFTAQSTSFMNATVNQKGSSLVPGTIYSFDDYSKGNFKEFADGRNPIMIYTTTTVGNNSANIQSPNGQTISQGVSSIVSQFSPNQGGASGTEQIIYSDNQSDLNLMVSAGGSYSAYSGFGVTKQSQAQHHVYVTFDAIKPMYTIIVQRPANGYFADGNVPASSSPLVVVQNVTYGTRILANIDIQTSATTNYDSLHLQYTSGPNNGKLDFSALANNNTVNCTGNIFVVGTGTNIPIVSSTLQNFEQQISNLFSQSNYRTALPIQYELSDLDGNTLGIESATDQFSYPDCTPVNEVFYLQSVIATIGTGDDGKNDNSEFYLELYKGTPTNNVKIGQYYNNNTEFKKENGPMTVPVSLPGNTYTLSDFNNGGAILLRLTAHGHSGDDWDISNLKLTLNFLSQKGTPKQLPPINISSFRFSDKSNRVFYFDSSFKLIQ